MTEADKQATLDMIAVRIAHCEHHGQSGTANLWRQLYVRVADSPAALIVCSQTYLRGLAAFKQTGVCHDLDAGH